MMKISAKNDPNSNEARTTKHNLDKNTIGHDARAKGWKEPMNL